jgi:hypothetical protein
MVGHGMTVPGMDYYRSNADGEGDALKLRARDLMRRQR